MHCTIIFFHPSFFLSTSFNLYQRALKNYYLLKKNLFLDRRGKKPNENSNRTSCKPLLLSLPVTEWMDEWIWTSTHATGNTAHAHPRKRRREKNRKQRTNNSMSLSLFCLCLANLWFLSVFVGLFVCLLSQCVSVLLLANWMMYTRLALFFVSLL